LKVSPEQFALLKDFCEDTKLKRTLLLEIASRLPMNKADKVLQIFNQFDVDKDACLSKQELRSTFEEMGIHEQSLVDRVFNTLDVDSDGLLSVSEFSAGVLIFFKDLLDDRLHAMFRRRDRDSNGYLDEKEAKEFLASCTAMLTKGANQRSFDTLAKLLQGGKTKIHYEDLRDNLLGF